MDDSHQLLQAAHDVLRQLARSEEAFEGESAVAKARVEQQVWDRYRNINIHLHHVYVNLGLINEFSKRVGLCMHAAYCSCHQEVRTSVLRHALDMHATTARTH